MMPFKVAVACFFLPLASPTGLKLSVYKDTAMGLSGNIAWSSVVQTARIDINSSSVSGGPFSAELLGTVSLPFGTHKFDCTFAETSLAWLWIGDHMVCSDGKSNPIGKPGAYDNPLPVRRPEGRPMTLRASFMRNATFSSPISFSMRVNGTTLPASSFSADLLPGEIERRELQRGLARGWAPWIHHNILDIVKVREGIVVTPTICQHSTGTCIEIAVPDGQHQSASNANARVGLHAPDRSYVQFFVGPMAEVAANVSVAYSSGPEGNIDILVSPVSCSGGNWSDFTVEFRPRFAWFRAGNVRVAKSEISFQPFGFPPVSLVTTEGCSNGVCSLANSVGASTTRSAADDIASYLLQKETEERDALKSRYGAQQEVGEGVQASVMWTLISTPAEAGPLMPVSRSWNFVKGASTTDFQYVIFDWDNIFASYIAAYTAGKGIAYSNLIQVIRSKTADGFVPNFAGGGSKSMDRTEPPIGAKVLLELYRKFGDEWIVALLYDDLKDWNDWFTRERVLEPLGLIALGSWNKELARLDKKQGGDPGNNMQDARYESGLDNSPMYDGDFFDTNKTHLMQLYDVGMSSMVVQEAFALAELASIVKRPAAEIAAL